MPQMPMVLRCGAAVLQDMAVAVADATADAYLAEAGVSRAGEPLPELMHDLHQQLAFTTTVYKWCSCPPGIRMGEP